MKRFGILGCALFIAMAVGCGNDTETIGDNHGAGSMAGEGSGGGSSDSGGSDSGGSNTGGKPSGGSSNTGGKSSGGSTSDGGAAGAATGGMGGEETGGTGGGTPVDACDALVELDDPETVSGTTLGGPSTLDVECGSENPESGSEVAYTFTAGESGTLVVSVTGDADFILSVESGTSCGQPSETCSDDSAEGGVETVQLEVAAGETFTIVVDGYDDAASSPFTLTAGVNHCTDFDPCTVDIFDAGQAQCFSSVPHDVCDAGEVLSPDSACTAPQTACVQAVCEQNAACCTDVWNEACVDAVATSCNITCN